MNEHLIHYDIDEAFSFKLTSIPSQISIDVIIEEIAHKINKRGMINIQKVLFFPFMNRLIFIA